MINKILFLSLIAGFFSVKTTAQAIFEFNETTYDFQQVAEGTQAVHEFIFKNVGDTPLVISSVRASCGCTTPYWTKEPVQPGETGVIKASYNSKNRPGSFHKSITITSNAKKNVFRLYIKGSVVPEDQIKREYTEEEKAASPKIDVLRENIQLGKTEIGNPTPFEVPLKNTGKTNLVITGVQSNCKCYTLASKTTVAPGEGGTLQLIYTPGAQGKKVDLITFSSNDITDHPAKLTVSSEVVKSLSTQSMLRENGNNTSF